MSNAEDHSGERRDFLFYATGGTAVVVTGAAVWPLVNQMNPSADTRAAATMRVDVSGVFEGSQISVLFQGKPIFIRHRTAEEIEDARSVDLAVLPDNDARNANLSGGGDGGDENRALALFGGTENTGEWLVMQGVCTHLGCVPLGDGAGDFGGWFCPCHGSHYDTSGRIRRGPAPENLPVPHAAFVSETEILLGEAED